MKNYTTLLPGKNNSKVEWNYPVEIPQLTEDQIREIEISIDPNFMERKRAEEYLKNRFINPFIIMRKKFDVLKKVNDAIDEKIKNGEYPTDVAMLLLYEDSTKQCALSFSETAKKLISLFSDLEGKYLHLLRRSSMKVLANKLAESDPTNAFEYKKRLNEYYETWDKFFPSGTNNKNGPVIEDVNSLKDELESSIGKLKAYRDQVAAHFDDEIAAKGTLPNLLWTEFEITVLYLQNLLENFHFLLSHAKIQCQGLDGIGFTSEENTVKSYINGIFQSYEC
ncbi:MAG: hypothetical protein ACHQUC_03355 [Chlamydiales bacterium]